MSDYKVYNINEEIMDDMTQFTGFSKNITIASAMYFFYEENIMKPLLKLLKSRGFEVINEKDIGSPEYLISVIDKNNEEVHLFKRSKETGLLRLVSKDKMDEMLF